MGSLVYHKINSIQKRVAEGPGKGQFTGEWADPNFEELQDLHWICREKIDGTNIRVHLSQEDRGEGVSIQRIKLDGRTDKSAIPKPLLTRLNYLFNDEVATKAFTEIFDHGALETGVTIYGEGYGSGIQKGEDYGPVDFIVFDIRIGHMWLVEEAVTSISLALGLKRVPIYENIKTLRDAISIVSNGTLISHWPAYGEAEGIVAVPASGILDRRGNRIVAKVKGVDFPNRHFREGGS
jgi:hypothetical protein